MEVSSGAIIVYRYYPKIDNCKLTDFRLSKRG